LTRIKVCGITSTQDALFTAQAGVDAIGLVFFEKSPRNVTAEQAKQICAVLPPFVTTVGLFVNAEKAWVETLLETVPLDVLQFHGAESPEYCASFSRPYIKAVPMNGLQSFEAYADQYPDAQGFLVDSHAPDTVGGTGETFDWKQVPQDYPKPIILAGGLKPENVAQAIEMTHVYAVDVSSGVEATKGVKSEEKVKAFVQNVRSVKY
jgi:phosphoribosylanthranilate isomerase